MTGFENAETTETTVKPEVKSKSKRKASSALVALAHDGAMVSDSSWFNELRTLESTDKKVSVGIKRKLESGDTARVSIVIDPKDFPTTLTAEALSALGEKGEISVGVKARVNGATVTISRKAQLKKGIKALGTILQYTPAKQAPKDVTSETTVN